MIKEKLIIGVKSKPRFEFRSFGKDFNEAFDLMSRLSNQIPDNMLKRTSKEIYILSANNDINNTKIRNSKIDIKTLVQEVDGLEQWNPLMQGEFPMSAKMLEEKVFPAFKVEMSRLQKNEYKLEEFLAIVENHQDLHAVTVKKERSGYMVYDTICEYANVWINDEMVVTISSESTEIEDVKKTIKDLGIEGFENINYIQAIKRVIGLIDKKLAN